MSNRSEREALAKAAREDALRFLQAHPDGIAVSTNPQVSLKSRDNTFEQLRELKETRATETVSSIQKSISAVAAQEPKKVLPAEWHVEGAFFVHSKTGCAIRSREPPVVEGGTGSSHFLPAGWKIIRAPENRGIQPYFYWNPLSGETTWVPPKAIEAGAQILESPSAQLLSTDISASNHATAMIGSEKDSQEAEIDQPVSSGPIVAIEQRAQKKIKTASLFAS